MENKENSACNLFIDGDSKRIEYLEKEIRETNKAIAMKEEKIKMAKEHILKNQQKLSETNADYSKAKEDLSVRLENALTALSSYQSKADSYQNSISKTKALLEIYITKHKGVCEQNGLLIECTDLVEKLLDNLKVIQDLSLIHI